jgi:glyoxylase-like metal-dependent hydrolase (beta-lactamase superfamily II)
MTLHCFSTGRVRLKRGDRGIRRYLPGGWRDDTLPVNVFVIEHPEGVCLFDAGQTALAGAPGYFPRWYPFFHLSRFELAPEDEADRQLRRIGLEPSDVRWLVLSHLHTDHVGGLAAFRSAEVIVSGVEWRRAVGLGGRLRGYLPQYWPEGVVPRLIEFSTRQPGLPVPAVDLVGDGSLMLIPTPGHTPGHVGLLACEDERTFFIGGDVVHRASELATEVPWLAELCSNRSATVLTTHDPDALELAVGMPA